MRWGGRTGLARRGRLRRVRPGQFGSGRVSSDRARSGRDVLCGRGIAVCLASPSARSRCGSPACAAHSAGSGPSWSAAPVCRLALGRYAALVSRHATPWWRAALSCAVPERCGVPRWRCCAPGVVWCRAGVVCGVALFLGGETARAVAVLWPGLAGVRAGLAAWEPGDRCVVGELCRWPACCPGMSPSRGRLLSP